MMPGMDPQQISKLMKSMGIKSTNIECSRVIIECENENIVISEPQVTEIDMKGQKTFQVAGTISSEGKTSKEDVSMVMEQTGASEEEAKKALEEANGDIAEAILKLKKD